MDGFPVLTGILPHVREPEADVKGLKDHPVPAAGDPKIVPHFFAQSTLYSALTACRLGFNIDRDSTFAHLGLVQTFVSPVLIPFLA